ncbi:hypothetical protein GH5_05277 [Leishmania sp. Ghana 2012 LV757]|uniref:hypothetical protein n=1 Tax=Leishmania sp. Ghana 2012 LV757 TaxID=2803181 RepID=UPI001B742CC5|nr:hypothetical protein GH5_05277 [Leishmania sp. Ghana 2012 LV757]
MDSHMDPGDGRESISLKHPPSAGKRKLVRRAPDSDGGAAGDAISASATGSGALASTSPAAAGAAAATTTQRVSSEAECDALIKRIRQLEGEGAILSNTLTKVCEENGRLSGQISALEEKVQTLAHQPLRETSVLHSLFAPEKTGWFGGSKSAAREQLEQLSDALQSEFMAYKASHTSSNEEVQALVDALHHAHQNAQELASLVKEQQQLISGGPLAVEVHIVPFDEGGDRGAMVRELQEQLQKAREQAALTEDLLRSSQAEVRALKAESAKLSTGATQSLMPGAPAAAAPVLAVSVAPLLSETPEVEALERVTHERDALQHALAEARNAIVEKEKDAELQRQKVAQLQNKLTAKDSVHTEEVDKLRQQLADSFSASMACGQCEELRQELEKARRDMEASQLTVQDLRQQIVEVTVRHETKYNELEKKLVESLDQLNEKEQQLRRSTSTDDYDHLKLERESLTHEIGLYKQRIAFLEASRSASDDTANATALDEKKVLETLHITTERISKLEFERDQLVMQLQQAQSNAVSREAEMRQLQQRSEDDKHRIAFLVKKSASLTADVRSATAQLDTFKEQFEKQSLELKQERRNTEGMTELQKQFDELSKEKRLLEDRLAATQEVEERLVKAKETIAYMELAQSSTISMSRFAELKAEKEKLQNTMEPLERQLEEAKQEIERLKAVTDAQQAISATQNKNVRAWQDQATALSESEAKLRDKVATLTAENTRLAQVNVSLEQQMNDMQDGIKEMALHMERDRSSAKAAAEANSQRQIQALSDELAQARATIAEVQARDGQYVAEGLYQSVVAERERALEESKKLTFELEKRKSEISIYRQTIADLEQENDERVKEIEALQDRYQGDRASLNDRLSKELKRMAELSSNLASLTEQVSVMEAAAARHTATITELQEKNAKQQRVFEGKCRREEALNNEIKRLNDRISTLQETVASAAPHRQNSSSGSAINATGAAAADAASAAGLMAPAQAHRNLSVAEVEAEGRTTDGAASPLSPTPAAVDGNPPSPDRAAEGAAAHAATAPDPAVIDTFLKRINDLQCDNDRLTSELKRAQEQHRAESADDQHMITILQTQIKNRLSTNGRVAYEAEIAKSAALKKSIEALMEENAQLRKQTGVAQLPVNVPASAFSVAVAGSQQMDVLQLQSQVQAQKAAFDLAMETVAKAEETYRARIQELEEQLHEVEAAAAAAAAAAGSGGDVATDAGTSLFSKPTRRKVKKVKKRTLAEQVGATDDGEDILATPPAVGLVAAAADNSTDAEQLQTPLLLAQREVAQLEAENAQLKDTIAKLSGQLQLAEEDLQAAQEDFDMAQRAMDEERCDLQKQIDFLQTHSAQWRPSADEEQPSKPSGRDSIAPNGGVSAANDNRFIADVEMQLRASHDEVERLRAENRNLQQQLEREEAHGKSPSSVAAGAGVTMEKSGAEDVRKLQLQLRQKDAEIKALADQLMPTKEKLVEYMAMADRLGLQYPFPPALEGATVLRLKALHLPVNARSASAPAPAQQQPRRTRSGGTGDALSPPPRTPRARRIGSSGGAAQLEGEGVSLR